MKDYALYIFDWQDTITSSSDLGLSDKVLELLKHLQSQGKKMAVATGGSRSGFNMVLNAFKLQDFFVCTRTADECDSKPSPQMINEILSTTGIDKKDAVMIGDTSNDMLMAQNAGIDCIGICQGYESRSDLQRYAPICVFDNIKGLYETVVA